MIDFIKDEWPIVLITAGVLLCLVLIVIGAVKKGGTPQHPGCTTTYISVPMGKGGIVPVPITTCVPLPKGKTND